jgi:hypothetical protein
MYVVLWLMWLIPESKLDAKYLNNTINTANTHGFKKMSDSKQHRYVGTAAAATTTLHVRVVIVFVRPIVQIVGPVEIELQHKARHRRRQLHRKQTRQQNVAQVPIWNPTSSGKDDGAVGGGKNVWCVQKWNKRKQKETKGNKRKQKETKRKKQP